MNHHPIWKIGLFNKISKEEAECIVCKQEGKPKYLLKLCNSSIKSLKTHMMGLHSNEYAEKFNSFQTETSKDENKIIKFLNVTSGGFLINFLLYY
jgi:hypothetical protein